MSTGFSATEAIHAVAAKFKTNSMSFSTEYLGGGNYRLEAANPRTGQSVTMEMPSFQIARRPADTANSLFTKLRASQELVTA